MSFLRPLLLSLVGFLVLFLAGLSIVPTHEILGGILMGLAIWGGIVWAFFNFLSVLVSGVGCDD